MKDRNKERDRIVSVVPAAGGFGYAVFENPYGPIDWGMKRIASGSHEENIVKIRALIQWYEPTLVVVENFVGYGSRRSPRVQALIRSVAIIAADAKIPLKSYSRGLIRQAFEATRSVRFKHDIASVIAREFRVLAPYLPRRRRAWESEHRQMHMFDAAALVMAHRYFQRKAKRK